MVGDAKQTLYVRNLCDKVRKNEMRRSLYQYFSQFGRVLDVVAQKTPKTRGQAFVVFTDTNSSSAALRASDGNVWFYGKQMRVSYANKTSFVVDPSARVKREEAARKAKDAKIAAAVSGGAGGLKPVSASASAGNVAGQNTAAALAKKIAAAAAARSAAGAATAGVKRPRDEDVDE